MNRSKRHSFSPLDFSRHMALDFFRTRAQSCIKFKKFRSRSVHHNDLREKIKIKFTGISELDLSFQLTMIWYELKLMVISRVEQCPVLKGGKNAKALSTCNELKLKPAQFDLEGKIKLIYPSELELNIFSSSSKYLCWSVNSRSVLICYATLTTTQNIKYLQ